MSKKISVIVPIYNVEKYLEKCVKSITTQTYHNLEIILVDDGSPDNSGKLCDELAKEDSRIKVIHKNNGGLSDARNAGVKIATGDYISFIDSDDWVDNDLYERVIEENKSFDADIITYGIYIDYDNGKTVIKTPKYKELIDCKKGLIYLNSYKNIDVSACNKLYKKELFDNILFPVGKYCEDYYVMYKIFDSAKKILILPFPKYHYFQRTNSITKNKNLNMDYIYASEEQKSYILNKYPDLEDVAITNYAFANLTMYNLKVKRNLFNDNKEKRDMIRPLKKFVKNILKNKYIPMIKKIQYLIFIYLNPLYYIIIKNK